MQWAVLTHSMISPKKNFKAIILALILTTKSLGSTKTSNKFHLKKKKKIKKAVRLSKKI
jgi:hypothetical protein